MSATAQLAIDAKFENLTTEDTREQPWKKYMAAEKAVGDEAERGRPWVRWAPKADEPWAKPWVEWHHELNRSLSPTQGS